jgi:hypothetical protein
MGVQEPLQRDLLSFFSFYPLFLITAAQLFIFMYEITNNLEIFINFNEEFNFM